MQEDFQSLFPCIPVLHSYFLAASFLPSFPGISSPGLLLSLYQRVCHLELLHPLSTFTGKPGVRPLAFGSERGRLDFDSIDICTGIHLDAAIAGFRFSHHRVIPSTVFVALLTASCNPFLLASRKPTMPRFTFPLPGRSKKHQPQSATTPTHQLQPHVTKAHKVLGSAHISIDPTQSWDGAPKPGLFVSVSEDLATAATTYDLRAVGEATDRQNAPPDQRSYRPEP